MIPYCRHAGIGVIPWSPLAQGKLARPSNDAGTSTRAQSLSIMAHLLSSDADKAVIDRLEAVAKRLGKSMASVAIAWSLSKGVNPILGLQSIERIDEAVETVNLELSDEDLRELDEVYVAKKPAPVY